MSPLPYTLKKSTLFVRLSHSNFIMYKRDSNVLSKRIFTFTEKFAVKGSKRLTL